MGTPKTANRGGARRDRTADLLHAMQALSQLSYGPTEGPRRYLRPPTLSRTSGWPIAAAAAPARSARLQGTRLRPAGTAAAASRRQPYLPRPVGNPRQRRARARREHSRSARAAEYEGVDDSRGRAQRRPGRSGDHRSRGGDRSALHRAGAGARLSELGDQRMAVIVWHVAEAIDPAHRTALGRSRRGPSRTKTHRDRRTPAGSR